MRRQPTVRPAASVTVFFESDLSLGGFLFRCPERLQFSGDVFPALALDLAEPAVDSLWRNFAHLAF